MTIDEAIENLKQAKKRGVKSIILAWWGAEMFDHEDDEHWEEVAAVVEEEMDWSSTCESIEMTMDLYTSD